MLSLPLDSYASTSAVTLEALAALAVHVASDHKVVLGVGAGISTAAGIPVRADSEEDSQDCIADLGVPAGLSRRLWERVRRFAASVPHPRSLNKHRSASDTDAVSAPYQATVPLRCAPPPRVSRLALQAHGRAA